MNVLISVADKTGIDRIAKYFEQKHDKIFASNGTKKFLEKRGINTINLETLTGFKELLNGRIKTLHPSVHAGILARKNKKDIEELRKSNIPDFDIVIVNLYKFNEKEKNLEKAIESIDIGGQALIRAAAKNFERVAVIVSPEQYNEIIREIEENGRISLETRKKLAAKAFEYTAKNEIQVSNFFKEKKGLPETISFFAEKVFECRYGENPGQKAGVYSLNKNFFFGFKQVNGRQLSYNNFMDFQAAIEAVNDFKEKTVAIIKHNTISGIASNKNLLKAFKNAWKCDSKSAFGSIIAFNSKPDKKTAREISKHFIEGIAVPEINSRELKILSKKPNLIIIKTNKTKKDSLEIKSINNAFLVQTKQKTRKPEIVFASKKKPTKKQLQDLFFAWKAVKHVKSNAIVLAKNNKTIGIGSGQQSRIDAVEISLKKAGKQAKNSVMASDAFFPFPDSIEIAAKHGVKAVIAPKGSKNDKVVIKTADKKKIALVFTNERQFKH